MATSDSMRKIYLEDSFEYFSAKSRGNTTTAIIISAIGAAFLVAGIAESGNDDSRYFFSSGFNSLIYTSMAVSFGIISIPFYVRGAHLKNTARAIIRTGRIPNPDFGSISPSLQFGKYVAIGVSIRL